MFFSSDYHFGMTKFEIMQRPFKNIDDMHETILSKHNEIVNRDDVVYVLGDVCIDPKYLCLLNCMNGRKILLRGNHDNKFSNDELYKYFDKVVNEGEALVVENYNLNHYPTRSLPNSFALVGHIHSTWKVQLNMLNVGVDVHHFYPVPFEKISFFREAIMNYYDDDVWVGNNPLNLDKDILRRKRGSYFKATKEKLQLSFNL
jgi:calcineurin-like phosphoesterase family protein